MGERDGTDDADDEPTPPPEDDVGDDEPDGGGGDGGGSGTAGSGPGTASGDAENDDSGGPNLPERSDGDDDGYDLYDPPTTDDSWGSTDDVLSAADESGDDGDGSDSGGSEDDADAREPDDEDGNDAASDDVVTDPGPTGEDLDINPAAEADYTGAAEESESESVPNPERSMSKPTDGGTVRGGDGVGGTGFDETAPDDEEMPLADHVEEMALRLLAVGLVMFGVAGIVLFYSDELINFLWYSFIGPEYGAVCPGPECPRDVRPRVYHPLALVLARLKVSTMVGFVLALPVAVYQTYRFMRPGLYPNERRYYLAAVPTSLVLAATGIAMAYFAVLPSLFSYFRTYSEEAAVIAFGLTETFNLIVIMLGFFALIFQIPLLVMLAIMMGVTTREWMQDRRLYFWGGFAAVAFVFSPDPTGMAPLIVAVTMIGLFEGTLTLLRWVGEGSIVPTPDGMAARRPLAYLAAALGGYLVSAAPVPTGYYGQLPGVVRETLAYNGLTIYTPLLIAGALIALFEGGAFLLRRFGHTRRALKARLAVDSARRPVWLVAIVVGYFGSPNPLLLEVVDDVSLAPVYAAGVAVGLIALYELAIVVLRWRENRAAAEA
ncbi:twin-arginine translocase subunit TatC [Halomicrobium urmianum]|uniref:twin-arginine translocase subunit TatC n=1 Tax=Halomicrobium urmianum TaxID=1586233 RepID=UPI001CD9AF68|nr:twin-arginine translocase subunit TatC [Halomicrobium urmianum]